MQFTIRELLELYLRHSKATNLHCRQSLAEREHIFGLFIKVEVGNPSRLIGDMAGDECKAYHLSDWVNGIESWSSSVTKRSKANMIKAAFQWAVDGDRIVKNPFKMVRYAESEPRPPMKDDQYQFVTAISNKQFERALQFLRLTGCRLSEMCRLKWRDVDLDKGVATVPMHKSRKSTRKPKLVMLIPEAVDLLKTVATLHGAAPDKIVFTNTRGTGWNEVTMGQHLRRMKAKHNLTFKATLHGLRHQFATAAIAAGAPVKLVSQQLGHSSISTTERYYVHLRDQEPIRAATALGVPVKAELRVPSNS